MTDAESSMPLSGVRVLDLTQVMAGPWATQLLADLGAEVIKIEPPGGDQARRSFGAGAGAADNPAFRAVNRNKRSVVIDLRGQAGKDAFRRLLAGTDVVIENFRPGVAQKLGVDAATLRAIDPRLIVASLTGFGVPKAGSPSAGSPSAGSVPAGSPSAGSVPAGSPSAGSVPAGSVPAGSPGAPGSLATRPGYDLIGQAMTGLMSVTGTVDAEPVKTGVPITDLTSGMYAVIGILAALRHRDRTGVGQSVQTSLYQAGLSLLVWESTEFWATGEQPRPTGSAHRLLAPYQALRTRDSHLVVAANNDKLWTLLLATLGASELADDARFATNADRLANRAELAHALEGKLIAEDTDHWVQALVAAGVPAAPVRTVGAALTDPHTLALQMVGQVQHPVLGEQQALGVPVTLDAPLAWPGSAAPALGADTRSVLRANGFPEPEIEQLLADNVVMGGAPVADAAPGASR